MAYMSISNNFLGSKIIERVRSLNYLGSSVGYDRGSDMIFEIFIAMTV
jgi:hypothetical protein